MSDTPLPPQTDYPYAARTHVGTPVEPPASVFARLAERLDIAVDWQPAEPVVSEGGFLPVSVLVFGACAFAVINVLPLVAIQLLDRSVPPWLGILCVAPFCGVIAGEFLVFALVLVWWRGSFLVRLALHWLVALSLFCCWALGFAVFCALENRNYEATFNVGWMVLAAIPIICVALQTPLWYLRIYAGWRIEDTFGDVEPEPAAPLSIRDVMIGTAVAAASVAMLRVMFDKPEKFAESFWIGWGVAFPSLALISLLAVAPLMWLILSRRHWLLILVVAFAYCFFIASTITNIFLFVDPDGEGKAAALFLSLATLTGLATVSIPLWIAPANGYRLRTGKSSAKAG